MPSAFRLKWRWLGLLVAGKCVLGLLVGAAEPEYDLIVANGLVYDGTGNPPQRSDVAVRAGRIVRVGTMTDATARRRIDATGLAVAPGFIDLHTHIDKIREMPAAENMVRQGVTTMVAGVDGYGPWPLAPHLAQLEKLPLGPNVAFLAGLQGIRRGVVNADRPATADERATIAERIEQAMRDGAFGFSTGGPNAPNADETIALARVVARHGGIFSTHVRNEARGVLASVEEAIGIGREARLPVVLTHHKVSGQSMWGSSAKTLAMVDAARRQGVDIVMDQYPYTASSISIFFLIPNWARQGGAEAFARRVADPNTRTRILREIVQAITTDGIAGDVGDLSRIQFANVPWRRELEGRTLRDWCVERGLGPTPENAAELVIEAHLAGGIGCTFHTMDEGDVERIMRHPETMIASDATLARPGEGHPHPRCYGTFPRVLGRYVREKQVLTLETAIRKMTQMPARRLAVRDRGEVRNGYAADLVIFDPKRVIDVGTFERPHQYPRGIPYVIVNGIVTVDGGALSPERGGKVLRRSTE